MLLGTWIMIGAAIVAFYHAAFLSMMILAVSIGYFVWLWRTERAEAQIGERPVLSYRCLSCGAVHRERMCPACKSNIKQAIF